MNARSVLRLVSVVMTIALMAPLAMLSAPTPVAAQQPVTLNLWSSPDNADALNWIANNYMKANPNVKIVIQNISWETLYAKMLADAAAGTGAFDIATYDVMTSGALSNDLVDLGQFAKDNPTLVDPNWDPKDFDPTVWQISAMWGNKQIGIPFYNNTMLLYYRKDLFDNKDLQAAFQKQYNKPLEVPKTWADAVDVAKFFTKKDNPQSPIDYGIGLMFPRTHTIFYMYPLWFSDYRRSAAGLKAYGPVDLNYGDYFTSDKKPAFANQDGVNALKDMMALMPYAPDPLGSDYGETMQAFAAGSTAMVPQWTGVWPTFKTAPALQPFDQKVGVAVMPGGHSVSGNWGLGINIASKNKAEAYKFIQYATNKENDKQKFIMFGVAPTRLSTLADPQVLAADPRVPALKATYPEEAQRPRIPEEPKLEEITNGTLTDILGGQQPNTVDTLTKLANQWNQILSGGQ